MFYFLNKLTFNLGKNKAILIFALILIFASSSILFLPKNKVLQIKTQGINDSISKKLSQKPNNFLIKGNAVGGENGDYNKASSYIVINQDTGDIIAEKNSKDPLPIASLTKIMTAVVALDLAGKDEEFKVSFNAARTPPTKIGVVAGETMTLEELLNATLLTSANDAATVIKEGVESKYNSKIFINAMNKKTKFLNLKNTHFSNTQGFDNKNNYSSSEDLAILSNYALSNYPLISEITKKDYVFLPKDKNHKQFDLYNWNGLLGVYPGISGLKIGNTEDAGVTTVVSATREGKRILAVLLGAPGVLERDLWASELLDIGFKKTANLSFVGITPQELKNKYSTWKYWN